MHRVLVNSFVFSLPRKSAVRSTDRLDLTIAIDWDIKSQTKQKSDLGLHCLPFLSFQLKWIVMYRIFDC